MKSNFLIAIYLFFTAPAFSQHCPWDCSGMIILETSIPQNKIYGQQPTLVDENKKEVVDTIYGTGLDTHDHSEFLSYEDFTALRTKKIAVHHWYRFDTVYHFTKGKYLVRFNFCKYTGKKLYLRYSDRYTRGLRYHYIEIPGDRRIHLHDYYRELNSRKTADLKKLTDPFIIQISCDDLKLRAQDCK